LSNILAALGRAQLSRLDDMISSRRNIRNLYRNLFENVDGVEIFDGDDDSEDNCWLTSIIVDSNKNGLNIKDLIDHLATSNIETRPLWKPMHLQPLFLDSPNVTNGNSEHLFKNGLTLPSGSGLSDHEIGKIQNNISRFFHD
jgi:dTDP-4-amino-4,6-dideoxygalactose transaminase